MGNRAADLVSEMIKSVIAWCAGDICDVRGRVLMIGLAMLRRSPAQMPSLWAVTSGISCGLQLTGTMSVPLADRVLAPAASDDR